MTDQVQNVTSEELAKRKAAIQDAYNFSAYIPDELRGRLETLLIDPEARTAVLELQILAIKYGRALERRDLTQPRIEYSSEMPKPSRLVSALVDRAGQQIHKINEDKKVDILVAPGFLDVTKKGSDSPN